MKSFVVTSSINEVKSSGDHVLPTPPGNPVQLAHPASFIVGTGVTN